MKFLFFLGLIAFTGCASKPVSSSSVSSDEYLWLEEIESPKSLKWVEEKNQKSLGYLKQDSRYQKIQDDIEKILANKDRIPSPIQVGDKIYNFWTDEKNPRGLWRRCSLKEYKQEKPNWELLLDVDALGKAENTSWVYKGSKILEPHYDRALVYLSRGGKDSVEVREFDLVKREFVKNGFFLPEAKSKLTWIDADTLLVSTDFGPGSLTTSGYPMIVKKWKRGMPLSSAKTIFTGKAEDVSVNSYTLVRPEGKFIFIYRGLSFYENETYYLDKNDELIALPLPKRSYVQGLLKEKLYVLLKENWTHNGITYPLGALVSLDIKNYLNSKKVTLALEYLPTSRGSIENVTVSKSKVWLEIMYNVKPAIYELVAKGKVKRVQLPEIGTASIQSSSFENDNLFFNYSSFLNPPSLYFYENKKLTLLKSTPEMFNSKGLMVQQFESISSDGTKIPYFVIHKKDLVYNSQNPTLLYAYGGFEYSMQPYYNSTVGKSWLEKGGVYVQANIRGGGEFGPQWHQAALKTNRQKAFDDFYSVAEDLAKRKITSPAKLAIKGGSNGGLLVGTAFTQKPELFGSAICEVPLLDMLRYHKLLAGASWMAEYGNPDIPEERAFLEKYSPYQNLKPNLKYPKVFFTTSTKDDRVHPGHARKMVAKFEEYKLPYLYFENTEGGHGAAADLKQRAQYQALQYIFLHKELMDEATK